MWPWKPKRPRSLGERGEDAAAVYLRRKGYTILARNVRLGRNELDIVAQQGDTVVFVEVRTRAAADAVAPEDTIGPVKQAHLKAAAGRYIARHYDPDLYYRFDIVAIIFPEDAKAEITHLINAFE